MKRKTRKTAQKSGGLRRKKVKVKISAKTTFFCLVAALFGFYYFYSFFSLNSVTIFKPQKYSSQFIVSKDTQKLLKKVIPTKSPTPTNTPLVGFCLHVPVLMYHHIQPEATAKVLGQTALTVDSGIFDNQMAYLAQNGYTTYFANDLINALISHQQLNPKSVVITIDDGYEDNFIYALPVLQKYGIKANIMLATGLMGNSNMLSWDEVKSLKNSGLIYFTNHTWSHYPVSKPPQEKIETEIDVAQNEIIQETGQSVNVFTYPYGAFNNNAIQTLQRKNYIGAFTEIPGQYQCDSFLMTLHRTRIGNSSLVYYGL